MAVGDGLGAEIALNRALAAGEPREAIAAYYGQAELQQGELAEARKWLGDGEFDEGSVGHGYHMLARLEMAQDNLPAAGRAFDRALQVKGRDPEIWVDIGRMRYRGGEQAEAIEASERALGLGPDNAAALQFRGQLIRDSEGNLAALPFFERALETNPDDVGLLGDYAATLGELGEANEMLAAARRMIELDPANRRALYLQAVLAARGGQFSLSRQLLGRSGYVDGEVPGAMQLSAVLDLESGNFASAAQMLERLSVMQPDNRHVQDLLPRALALGRNDRELIYRFGEAAKRSSASPYLRSLVARSYERLGEYERAAAFTDAVSKPRASNPIAKEASVTLDVARVHGDETGPDVLQLVRAALSARQNAEARESASRFLAKFPGSADALSLAGDTRLGTSDADKALDLYRRAAHIRRPWPLTLRMAAASQAKGDQAASLRLLLAHFFGDPGNAEAARLLATNAAQSGDWPAAAIFADRAIKAGAINDPFLMMIQAEFALQENDPKMAVEAAREAYALLPANPLTTRMLAHVYRETGADPRLAEALVRKAARLV
ncbi:tetratricopeptide repeat protein [Qipengyuania sp. JC766]|uniref:tetratricopeptide repeat protein n=1 Tax=Qipengyuania sp. JC766 TaxID=3232139 RepID=UPI00345ADE12